MTTTDHSPDLVFHVSDCVPEPAAEAAQNDWAAVGVRRDVPVRVALGRVGPDGGPAGGEDDHREKADDAASDDQCGAAGSCGLHGWFLSLGCMQPSLRGPPRAMELPGESGYG